jgi:phosphatidate phosphatase PAH1
MRKIVISDLDGTIALVNHRRHLVEGEKKDWRAFYAACVDDEPNEPVVETLRVLRNAGYQIVIVSARSKEVENETIVWLNRHEIPFDKFYMLRETGDYTSEVELKTRFLMEIEDHSEIFVIFDDRDSVVKMWREFGLPCFQVASGDF